jgi:hypothetical protein
MNPEKRIWLMLVLMLIVFTASTPANGQDSFMGVYLDENRTESCVTGEGVYQIGVWVYAKIDAKGGIKSWAFDLSLPPNLEMLTWGSNPNVIPVYCDPELGCPPGISGAFQECQSGWVWIRAGTFNVTSSDQGVFEIIPHPASGNISLSHCDGTVYYPTIVSSAYINYDCFVSA